MKNSAYIINMGRGPVLDEDALAVALAQGEIAGAGLDVLSVEPPKRSSPVPDGPGPLYTHIGGDTREAKLRTSERLSRTVLEALDGADTYNWFNRPR